MFSKLKEVEGRYEDLNAKLADPSIASDRHKYKEFAKERSNLALLVETYREYKKIISNISGNNEIIANESDEEMRKLAKDELAMLDSEKTYLENKLKVLLLPKDPNDEKIS